MNQEYRISEGMMAMLKQSILCVVMTCMCAQALSALPGQMNYRGKLFESGSAVSGTRSMEFRIYDALSGGLQLWTSGAINIDVSQGLYNYTLGTNPVIPAAVFTNDKLFLEVRIAGTPLSPRERLVTSPYAFNADMVDGKHVNQISPWLETNGNVVRKTGYVGLGTISPGNPLHIASSSSYNLLRLEQNNAGALMDFVLTDEGLDAGYAAPMGSLAVGAGEDWLKYGVGDVDWGRLMYYPSDGLAFMKNATDNIPGTSTGLNFNLYNNAWVYRTYASVRGHIQDPTSGNEQGALSFYTANPSLIEQMRIMPNGNVGIGTNSPTTKLDVNGQLNIFRPAFAGTPHLTLKNPSQTYSWNINSGIGDSLWLGGGGLSDFPFSVYPANNGMIGVGIYPSMIGGKFHVNNTSAGLNNIAVFSYGSLTSATNVMTITRSGRVGIGTGSPAFPLDVNGSVRASSFIGSGAGLLGIGKWSTNGTSIYYNAGNVGIGHSAPPYELTVVGRISGSENMAGDFGMDNTGRFGDLGGNGASVKFIADGSIEAMTINGIGNVGIGTTGPGAKLEVNGQVKINGGAPGAGKVLTSDATGLASWQAPVKHMARLTRAAAQSIPASSPTFIDFDTEEIDTTGIADIATDRITISKAGYYLVNCTITLTAMAVGQSFICWIVKNGTTYTVDYVYAATAGQTGTGNGTQLWYMNAGDYLQLQVFSSGAYNTGTANGQRPTLIAIEQ